MLNNTFIPSKIRVGFQKRTDTYTGKLGYVIYYDEKNKIRKETSFNGWISKDIAVLELDNTPQNGFIFNRGVNRSSSFSYSTAKIRVYDSRDFEFEIDMSNLVEIMKHSDISHQEISEKCVFAWQGKELVLLPVNSEIYINAQKYTTKLLNPLNVRNFIPGQTFKNKSGQELMYLGDYNMSRINSDYSCYYTKHTKTQTQTQKKQSFFYDLQSKKYSNPGKKTMIELFDENINPKFPHILENLQYGLEHFTFKDFIIQEIKKNDLHNKIVKFLKILKKTPKNSYYSLFPTDIFIKNGIDKYHSFSDNTMNYHHHSDKSFQLDISHDYNFTKTSVNPLTVEIHTSPKQPYLKERDNKVFKIKKEALKSMNEEGISQLANNFVEFLYSYNSTIYQIGFVNTKGIILSINDCEKDVLSTWNNYGTWR